MTIEQLQKIVDARKGVEKEDDGRITLTFANKRTRAYLYLSERTATVTLHDSDNTRMFDLSPDIKAFAKIFYAIPEIEVDDFLCAIDGKVAEPSDEAKLKKDLNDGIARLRMLSGILKSPEAKELVEELGNLVESSFDITIPFSVKLKAIFAKILK